MLTLTLGICRDFVYKGLLERMSNVGQQLLSGALSGFATTVCLQPFDLLKTRMQQGDGTPHMRRNALIFSTAREVVAQNGLAGLWRGTAASLIRNVPGVALYMTGLTQLRTIMATSPYFARVRKPTDRSKNLSVLPTLTSGGNLLAGATTRVAIGFLLNPFSVLKARFESNMYAYQSLSGALVSITRQGPSELLRGFLASSLRDAPYAGLFIVLYEGIKRETSIILPATSNSHAAGIHSFSAASAGAIATLATHPFDVIKTKIQVRSEDRYHGLFRTIRTIWMQRGLAGYFDGASLRLSRKVLSSAIGWAVYEGMLIFIQD
ncbi:Solute carrier family 25 member 38 [Hypsizygus marmoreus]|uniref:Mitochondrial glycine transporter n=1 Tax=Hypsizygus marmoreus TaxID=39966 RepID=A0A369J0D4_HYPMA|nr:Solute carrier family 25 member 38 [Hypsizygus marmoreus]